MKPFVGAFGIPVLLAVAASVWAASPPGDKPASPRSLPTDELPPFGMLDDRGRLVPLPKGGPGIPALPARPDGPEPPPAAGPPMDVAIEGAKAALEACARRNAPIAVAVVDAAGQPRALLMAEGTHGSVFVAMRKAAASLAYRIPSSRIGDEIAKDPALLARFTPVMFLSGGAFPIFRKGELIGAIGASGAHGAGPIGSEDEVCARVGLEKINARLGS